MLFFNLATIFKIVKIQELMEVIIVKVLTKSIITQIIIKHIKELNQLQMLTFPNYQNNK